MDRRFNRQSSNEGRPAIVLQKKLAETKRFSQTNNHQVPDLTDFMNDMFFGTIDVADKKKMYDLSGGRGVLGDEADDFDASTRSVSSRQTQEWLEEAKRIVALSPSRGADSPPSRLVGSPRFAQGRLSTSSLDRRDPFSRSARRNRTLEGTFSGEILSKTLHTRNRSDTNFDLPQAAEVSSPTSEVQKWISNNIQIPNNQDSTISPDPTPPSPTSHMGAPPLPPRQSVHRRSRFQTDRNAPLSQAISSPTNSPAISITKRNFKASPTSNNGAATILDAHLLSPPKHLVESAHRRSISSSTCSIPQGEMLSPPGNLAESAHQRSVSSNMCRIDRIVPREDVVDVKIKRVDLMKGQDLNGFLKEQRVRIGKLLSGEINGRAKIVLSGPSNSTSSMVAAVCYSWLLETKMRADKKGGGRNGNNLEFVLPVMNIRRGKMWKQRQAAWLFHHTGLDATSLLFSNEVDLETLMMSKQLSILVVGEDILRTNGEVGSACTMLTDNYCEDAYDLLQTPMLKKLLLAGILLDTQNLIASPKLSMTKDTEAVQLLSVASTPNYRNTLFDQLMQDQRDNSFFEVLQDIYGKAPPEIKWDSGASTASRISEKNILNEVTPPNDKKQNDINDARTKRASPIPAGKPTPPPLQAPPPKEPPRKNFFQKLFGFGSK